MKYAIWRACETFGTRPPGVKATWEEMDVISRADLLGYNQIRGQEEIPKL